MTFAIEVEGGIDKTKITNYDQIKSEIIEKLEHFRDRPKRMEKPLVYHIDVAAMYPNIILTNRLQPSAIVDDATCTFRLDQSQTNEHNQRLHQLKL
jgi:DNA polymerase epsilon subunit 1